MALSDDDVDLFRRKSNEFLDIMSQAMTVQVKKVLRRILSADECTILVLILNKWMNLIYRVFFYNSAIVHLCFELLIKKSVTNSPLRYAEKFVLSQLCSFFVRFSLEEFLHLIQCTVVGNLHTVLNQKILKNNSLNIYSSI